MVGGVRRFFQLLWAVLYTERSHFRVFFTSIFIAPLSMHAAFGPALDVRVHDAAVDSQCRTGRRQCEGEAT